MDDKQLNNPPGWLGSAGLKAMVRQRWLSTALFRNAARPALIRSVLKQAYPSGQNVDDALIGLLYQPTRREGAAEAFRGFINLFDDHLAPNLMKNLDIPVHLIWGEKDPWEPPEARRWKEQFNCVQSLDVIVEADIADEHQDAVNAYSTKPLPSTSPFSRRRRPLITDPRRPASPSRSRLRTRSRLIPRMRPMPVRLIGSSPSMP